MRIVSTALAVRSKLVSRIFAIAATVCLAPALLAEPTVALVQPLDRTVLQGGSVATIVWTATKPLPEEAEEWEAFLSVDGGEYYADRITPHLDIDLRSFEWHVPNVSSKSVRILIRIGNEHDEYVFELDQRLSIEATEELRPSFAPIPRSQPESARPGDPPVVEWASGDRRGRAVVHEHAAPVGDAVAFPYAEPISATHAVTPRAAESQRTSSARQSRFVTDARGARIVSFSYDRDILLLVRRLNI